VGDASEVLSHEVAKGRAVLFEGRRARCWTSITAPPVRHLFQHGGRQRGGGGGPGADGDPLRHRHHQGVHDARGQRSAATELNDATGEKLRAVGAEYGATTGRPRRCGWLDALVLRYAARVNGLSGLAMTKLDVLTGFEKDPRRHGLQAAQRQDGRRFPSDPELLEQAKPIYEELPGGRSRWGTKENIRSFRRTRAVISSGWSSWSGGDHRGLLGAERAQTIVRKNPFRHLRGSRREHEEAPVTEAIIVDAFRTARGKRKGALSALHPVDLLARTLIGTLERANVKPDDVDDVIVGCVTQVGGRGCTSRARGARSGPAIESPAPPSTGSAAQGCRR